MILHSQWLFVFFLFIMMKKQHRWKWIHASNLKFDISPKQISTNQRSYWFCINYKNLSFAGHWQLAFDPDSHVITKLNTCQCTVSFDSKLGYGLMYRCPMNFGGSVYSISYGIFRTVIIWMWNVPGGPLCLNICFLTGSTLLGDLWGKSGTFRVRVLAGISEPLEWVLCLWFATPSYDQAPRAPTSN